MEIDRPFELEDADLDIDDDSENGENSHPNISNADHVTFRKRDRGIRGMAFRFRFIGMGHTNVLTCCSTSDSALWEREGSFFWPIMSQG